MSHTTIWRVYKTKARPAKEFSNSWRSAPPLWDFMAKKYLGWDSWFGRTSELQKLWDLCGDERVPEHFRLTMQMTMDRVFVRCDRVIEVAKAMTQVGNELPISNHWRGIAAFLENEKPAPRQLGWGIGCTSVSDPWGGEFKGNCTEIKFGNKDIGGKKR
jgi:hypothetical protein